MEAYHCAGQNGTHAGKRATRQRLRHAFLGPNPVLLSCHGRFNAHAPLDSYFQLADGRESLLDLLNLVPGERPPVVVLAACEGGRASDAVTDEPDGFAPILFMRGLDAVMAPLWRVDDLSSYLFITKFFSLLGRTDSPTAAQQATIWLRDLTNDQALSCVERTSDQLGEISETLSFDEQAYLEKALATARGWLSRKTDYPPFTSPLDWAGYQLLSKPGRTWAATDEVRTASDEPHRFA